MDIDHLLGTYPRQRSPLTTAHQQIYDKEYRLNRSGKTFFSAISQRAEGWMHRQIACSGGVGTVLEVGAGTLNHLAYEPSENITEYDIIEPFETLYVDSPHKNYIRKIHQCVTQVGNHNRYDRIISIAVLEHLTDLPFIVASSALLLRENGLFQHGIPSEGALLWGLAWRFTTALSFRLRTGLSYQTLMRHEHVNTAPEVLAIIRYFFESVQVRRFPLPAYHLSLYTYVHAKIPNEKRCRDFLERRDGAMI